MRDFKIFYEELATISFKPATHWLDNEASESLKTFDKQQSVEYKPPPLQTHMHKRMH